MNSYLKSHTLNSFLAWVDQRQRSFRRRGVSLAKEWRLDELNHETVEITFKPLSSLSKARVTFRLWDDRWAQINAREISKTGWRWKWSTEGRIRPHYMNKAIVSRIEDTVDEACHYIDSTTKRLDAIWLDVLASGPRPI